MSIETQTASIRDRALAALAAKRQLEIEASAERARRDQEREAEQRAAVVARFQAQLDQRGFAGVVATDPTVEVEGVTLAFRHFNSGHGIVALAPCRECGMGNPEWTHVRDLADFGCVLAEWLPSMADHQCQTCSDRAFYASIRREEEEREAARVAEAEEWSARRADQVEIPAPAPTVEQQLVEALRRFVVALHDGGGE